jgi:ketosteroid isomerase-like protein
MDGHGSLLITKDNIPAMERMKTPLLAFSLLIFFDVSHAQQSGEQLIRKLLEKQTTAWNQGNIEAFMETYWKNDSLLFIGKNGVQHGWKQTLTNYKKAYPDTTAMGQLSFTILEMRPLSPAFYYVVGKWMLHRTIGDLSGHFDLLIRKIHGRWVIVADHSS